MSESCSVVSDSLWPHGLYSPWNSPGQNTGVGRLSLLQRTFLNQESNQGLLHCRRILYQLSYEGSICSKYTAMPVCVNTCVCACVLRGCEEWENEASLGSWTEKSPGPLSVLQFKVFEDFQSNCSILQFQIQLLWGLCLVWDGANHHGLFPTLCDLI